MEPVGSVGAAGVGAGDECGFGGGDGHVAAARDRAGGVFEAAGFVADCAQARGLCLGVDEGLGVEQPLPGSVGRAAVDDDDLGGIWARRLGTTRPMSWASLRTVTTTLTGCMGEV